MQTFRVNHKIIDPLLKVLLIISKTLEKDNSNDAKNEMGKDITLLLLKLIHKTEVTENSPET